MNCKDSTKIIIDQIIEIIEKLSDQQYQKPLDIFNGSSIGQHFRHILDFYKCILKGLESEYLDYSCREREVLVEQNAEYAINAFHSLHSDIQGLKEDDELTVYADFSTAEKDERPSVKSTIGRELMYAYDHAIHHLAMIKIGVKTDFPDISLNRNVGVAPSTIKHRTIKHN